jgi:adenylate cyclase
MFTDTVGYTASTHTDEARTLGLLREQETLVRPLFAAYQGREIKSTGDGFLVEFDSALKATQCALDIQRRIHERNAAPGVAPIQIRIGVHLGDVEQHGRDIFGDAVNIAARIEPVADPGGVCISGAVHEQVRNKIPDRLEKLPPKVLKGLELPMEVYRVVWPWVDHHPPTAGSGPTRLAVLPFANISPDPRDEYFADGLTEELITVLSQLPGLRVIARTSVMPYRATPKGVSQIGVELGVDAILEGSVRKAGDELRITVQLVSVDTQEHAWADTYDRKLENVFSVQADIAKRVAEGLKIQLLGRDEARLNARSLPRPESYLEYLQGRTSLHGFSEADMRAAKQHFERAVSLDEQNAAAHAGLADVHRLLGGMYHHLPKPEWEAASRVHAARAIELDPNLAEAHTSLAIVSWDDYDYLTAEKEFQRAIALNPSLAWARSGYGAMLADQDRPEEALAELALAEQLDPLSTLNLHEEVSLLTSLRRLDAAQARLEALGRAENFGLIYHNGRFTLSLVRGELGQSRKELDQLGQLLPGRPELVTGRAILAAQEGDWELARGLLGPIEALPEPMRPDTQLALVYALLGDLDSCFRWLGIAIEERRFGARFWRLEPTLAPVRGDPRFKAMLKKMNLA